jgi:hypothetical protein
LIEGFRAVGRETMSRFGQVLSATRAAVPSKTVAATFSPETQSILEATEEAAVKPIVAKRSQDWVFSVEESWATTTCGTRCAGKAEARFARLFSMTRPPPGRTMRIISGMAPFEVLT